MQAIHTPTDPCAERSAAARAELVAGGVDAETSDTTVVALLPRTVWAERPVRLIQHPSFLRTADLGPDPRFTLAGRAPHLVERAARAA